MKRHVLAAVLLGAAATTTHAVSPVAPPPIDLKTTSCGEYETRVIGSDAASGLIDPIDTVMWLLGFSVARAGDHVMYGDALTPFGFALDAACKPHPDRSLYDAVTSIAPKREHPMDLKQLSCAAYQKRHADLAHSDPENAATASMWLFGFSVGQSGRTTLIAADRPKFEATLGTYCAAHPDVSMLDALTAATPAAGKTRKKK